MLAVCLLACCGIIGVQAADKVYALTMGVRKYSANSTVSDGSSIATIHYTRLSDGTSGVADKIFDVQPGEAFTLTTEPAVEQIERYAFIGWFDGNGVLLSTDETIYVVVDRSTAVFAGYVEIAARRILTYTWTGEGSLSASSDRLAERGDGCIALVDGANATVTIKPANIFSVYVMKLNGKRVTMIENTARMLSVAIEKKDAKGAFKAIVNFVKFLLIRDAEYTIENITEDTTFEVEFVYPYFAKR